MEGHLLTKSEHKVDDVTIHGDSSSNDEHIVDITINGNSDEQTPRGGVQWSVQSTNRCVWILVEFVMTLFQIVVAIFFCTLTKDEQNPELEEYWFIWIIGYTCASIATIPLLCWRLWHCSETRTNEWMDFFEKMLAYFFVGWIVMFLWYFLTELSSCLDDTTQHFWLWMALLAFSCIRYVLPNLEFSVNSFVWPVKFCFSQIWEFFEKMIRGIGILCWCIEVDD
ncbi:hypothetical protein ISN44_As06g015550 [Arabidopsis suecica]|uniref:Transmembrane protein n=1 Tax=Arabidopsis suecica TaxID=45249 RepID=A0A8T2CD17_ARASU|nr:hypothetical protein ISN44_As06g015550 [Arabidopsis suecica]